jgi:glycosyltransferase A (GT-A) superfamily protein (DUF2064 family)
VVSRRVAAVLARPLPPSIAPPGIDPVRYAAALLEDTYEVLAGLAHCETAVVACPPSYADAARAVVWPGTPIATVDDAAGAEPGHGGVLVAAIQAVGALGAEDVVLVVPDAPDLPGLMVGKLFSALTGAQAAVCPAADGGLVALGVRLPVPDWLGEAAVDFDADDAVERVRSAAPDRRAVVVTPGWHRMRRPADVARLDPGLEGWEATRGVLSGH